MSGTVLDPKTGYPPGYEPSWWRCPKCNNKFHDSEQKGVVDVNWKEPVPCCDCDVDMVRCEGSPVLGSCPHCYKLIAEGELG